MAAYGQHRRGTPDVPSGQQRPRTEQDLGRRVVHRPDERLGRAPLVQERRGAKIDDTDVKVVVYENVLVLDVAVGQVLRADGQQLRTSFARLGQVGTLATPIRWLDRPHLALQVGHGGQDLGKDLAGGGLRQPAVQIDAIEQVARVRAPRCKTRPAAHSAGTKKL